jgi:hypothetical protein
MANPITQKQAAKPFRLIPLKLSGNIPKAKYPQRVRQSPSHISARKPKKSLSESLLPKFLSASILKENKPKRACFSQSIFGKQSKRDKAKQCQR